MPRVDPTPEFKKLALARRGWVSGAPSLLRAKAGARGPDVAGRWKWLCEEYATVRDAWVAGRSRSSPELRDNLASADLALTTRTLEDDLDTLAVIEALFERRYNNPKAERSILRLVAAKWGVARAVAVKAKSLDYARERDDAARWLTVETKFEKNPERRAVDESWRALRELVSGAGEADYEAAKLTAEAIRNTKGEQALLLRFIAFVFPDQPDWANERLRKVVEAIPGELATNAEIISTLLTSANDGPLVIDTVNAILNQCRHKEEVFLARVSCDMALSLDVASFAAVARALLTHEKQIGKLEFRALAAALGSVAEPEVAELLAQHLTHPWLGPVATTFFARQPALAASHLSSVAQGRSKTSEIARVLLERHAPKTGRAFEPEADDAKLPAWLREPPWAKVGKKSRTKETVLTLAVPELPCALDDHDGALAALRLHDEAVPEMDDALAADWLAQAPSQRRHDFVFVPRFGGKQMMRPPAAATLRSWNAHPDAHAFDASRLLVRFGTAAATGVFAKDPRGAPSDANYSLFNAYLRLVAPAVAPICAFGLARRPDWRSRSLAWLLAHPEVAASGLIPVALGPSTPHRADARAALYLLLDHGFGDTIAKAAGAFGQEARHAVEQLMELGPLGFVSVKGAPPAHLDFDLLELRLATGERVPSAALRHWIDLLRSVPLGVSFRAIDGLKTSFDPASLASLAWRLTEAWDMAGAKSTEIWMPATLARFGDAASVARFGALARGFAHKDPRKALLAIDILAEIGTDAALSHLASMADRARHAPVRRAATQVLSDVATSRGLTRDQLADRTAPDLELDRASGSMRLDLGDRTLVAVLSDQLALSLVDANGQKVAAFPHAGKGDDAKLVKAAKVKLERLREALPIAVREASQRLERAMVQRRAFTKEEFRAFVLGHPIHHRLARGLVWVSCGETRTVSFRVTEDGSFADSHDVQIELGEGAIRIPHVLELEADESARWAALFGDYQLIQPFQQLARSAPALTESELREKELTRWLEVGTSAGALLGVLDARAGWSTGVPSVDTFEIALRSKDGRVAHASVDVTGFSLDDVASASHQLVGKVRLRGAESFADVDPIDRFELVRTLERLRG